MWKTLLTNADIANTDVADRISVSTATLYQYITAARSAISPKSADHRRQGGVEELK